MAKKSSGKKRNRTLKRELRIAQRQRTKKTKKSRQPSEEVEAILNLKYELELD